MSLYPLGRYADKIPLFSFAENAVSGDGMCGHVMLHSRTLILIRRSSSLQYLLKSLVAFVSVHPR